MYVFASQYMYWTVQGTCSIASLLLWTVILLDSRLSGTVQPERTRSPCGGLIIVTCTGYWSACLRDILYFGSETDCLVGTG